MKLQNFLKDCVSRFMLRKFSGLTPVEKMVVADI